MTSSSHRHRRGAAAFTLTEVMITTAIFTAVIAGTLSVFMMGMRSMYKDTERLKTDATLRQLTLHVAKETIDSTEFYLFPNYESLDGSVTLPGDIAPLEPEEPVDEEIQLASGDCLVLVTRVTTDLNSNIRQFRIYYRTVASTGATGALRYYESELFGTESTGTDTDLSTLLEAVDLRSTPKVAGSRELAASTRGKPKSGGGHFPVFSTQAGVPSAANESVSLNVEVINGTSATNTLSSSSFNFTISPRK